MKKTISVLILISLLFITTATYARVGAHSSHSSHSSAHISSHSTSSAKSSSGAKTTIKGYKAGTGKTYTTPKSFTSKYNSSTIKTGKVNSNPSHYTSYSTTNMFRPNFWTAMWAFNCMNNNTQEASEQDISKELEERGYSQEEIKEILKEGEEAKVAGEEQQKEETIGAIVVISVIAVIVIVSIIFIIITLKP